MVLGAISGRFLHEGRLPAALRERSSATVLQTGEGPLAPGQRRASVPLRPMFRPPNVSSNPIKGEKDAALTATAKADEAGLRLRDLVPLPKGYEDGFQVRNVREASLRVLHLHR